MNKLFLVLALLFAVSACSVGKKCTYTQKLTKISAWVWFYCDTMVHIRLLTDGIKELEKDGKIRASWQVVVTFSDQDNPETTFSLEPAVSRDAKLGLPALQKDARTIAAALNGMMNDGARRLQRETGAVLAGAR